MNVKPGDFARVVRSSNGNLGKVCYIEGPDGWCADAETGEQAFFWKAILLEPANVHAWGRCQAGTKVAANDAKLQRIDPPDDWKEVFAAPPVKEVVL